MKKHGLPVALAAVLGSAFLLSACSGAGEEVEATGSAGTPAAESAASSTNQIATASGETAPQLARAEFAVEGMTCTGCVLGTRMALNKLDGVQQADASYDATTGKGAAWALYDPTRVSPERLMEAIRALGYTPTLMEG